jgi:excisionase family DNA binding protein
MTKKSFITSAEAAARMGVSESTVRRRIASGELRSVRDGNRVLVDESSVPAADTKRLNRREFLKFGVKATFGVLGVASSGFGVFALDKYFLNKREPVPALNEMFPEWRSFHLVPGMVHPVYGEHPDILKAQGDIAQLLLPDGMQPKLLSWTDLPYVRPDTNLFLIGGPLSNAVSRKWRTFEMREDDSSSGRGRLYLPGGPISELRWEFDYRKPDDRMPRPQRYINGLLNVSEPKFILDANRPNSPHPIQAKLQSDTDLLATDFLLVTYIPNRLDGGGGAHMILDIADLHGLGDQAFALIGEQEGLRKELYDATFKRGMRSFQVLYEVPVMNDLSAQVTKPGVPRLIDVHRVG